MNTHAPSIHRVARLLLPALLALAAVCPAPARAGPVAVLVEQARQAGSQRSASDVSVLGIELGLRTLAPPDASPSTREAVVGEALDILDAGAPDEGTLAGLMRGLAIIRESTDPRIASSLCFRSGASFSSRVRAEAVESLRIRCLAGQGDTNACACLPP